MATVTINGKTISVTDGGNISIINGVVTCNGVTLNSEKLNIDTVEIHGSVGSIQTASSNVAVTGTVSNGIAAGNNCTGNVNGNVRAQNNVACGNVGHDATAGNNLACHTVGRNAKAGNNIRHH